MPERKHSISDRHLRLLRRGLLVLLVLGILGAVVFGVRAVSSSRAWYHAPPEQIESWMSPRYIAMSQHVPPRVVEDILAPGQDLMHRKISLDDIADNQGVDVDLLIIALENAIAEFKDRKRD
ncbi:hypothetical protein [Loktanella sp. S4079]|uniref:hypothetical protein n=1 Tax=Loktanella sp. S4079 TaxID=579483 RepID=UPI0005FA1D54|nr:hypothetical protein [Loktanella sp. S4079]KJZ18904.1 hypothetical protein TW80_12570 [Loktanella sp. S4079]